MEFKFEGLDQLITSLERMEDDAEKGKKEALEAGADIMQKSAKSLARKRTGNLVEHIEKSEVEGDEIQVYVDNQGPAYYGHMLELGTKKMPAYPFMGPAFMRSRFQIELAMANAIRRRLGLL